MSRYMLKHVLRCVLLSYQKKVLTDTNSAKPSFGMALKYIGLICERNSVQFQSQKNTKRRIALVAAIQTFFWNDIDKNPRGVTAIYLVMPVCRNLKICFRVTQLPCKLYPCERKYIKWKCLRKNPILTDLHWISICRKFVNFQAQTMDGLNQKSGGSAFYTS